MAQFVLRTSGPKFYPKNGSCWLLLVNQKFDEQTLSELAFHTAQSSFRIV